MTGHGLSLESFRSSPTELLFGIGQGSAAGPAAWHSHLLMMIQTLQRLHKGYEIVDPTISKRYQQLIVSFVDDTSFILTSTPARLHTLIKQTDELLNSWHKILNLTGGQLALEDKTKWCLSYFDGSPAGKFIEPKMDGFTISINTDGSLTKIHRISPHHAERYLGVRLSVSGQMDSEFAYRMETAANYSHAIDSHHLSKHEIITSYKSVWLPKIFYCLPVTTFSDIQCHKIQSKILQTVLPKLGISRKFPLALVYGPKRFGGLEFENIYAEQGIRHILWMIYCLRTVNQISPLMEIYIRYAQLEAGISCLPKPMPTYPQRGCLTPSSSCRR